MPRTRIAAGWMVTILMLASVACDSGSTFEPASKHDDASFETQTAQGRLGLDGLRSTLGGEQATDGVELAAVRRTTPLTQDFTTTKVIGRLGGIIAGGGVSLVIPAGALRERTEITLTVPAGDYLDVRFAPHGLTFRLPAILSLSLMGTEAAGRPELLSELVGVYHTDDASDGTLIAEEVFGLQVLGVRAVFPIEHFSSYSAGYRRGFILVGA